MTQPSEPWPYQEYKRPDGSYTVVDARVQETDDTDPTTVERDDGNTYFSWIAARTHAVAMNSAHAACEAKYKPLVDAAKFVTDCHYGRNSTNLATAVDDLQFAIEELEPPQ